MRLILTILFLYATGAHSQEAAQMFWHSQNVVTQATLSAPTFSVPSSVTDFSATLIWSSVTSATSYTLQERTYGSGSFYTIYTGSGTSYSPIDLTAATHYEWRVQATATGFTSSTYSYQDATTTGSSSTTPFYIIVGQSNTGWRTYTELSTDSMTKFGSTQSYTAIYNPGVSGFSTDWDLLTPGSNTKAKNFVTADGIGFETSLFYYLNAYEPGQQRWLFKDGVGATSLGQHFGAPNWYPDGSTNIFKECTQFIDSAVTRAQRAGVTLDYKGMVWYQGEYDGKDAIDAANYATNLPIFFSAFESMVNTKMTAHGHIYHSGTRRVLPRIFASASWPYAADVRTAQENFCADAGNNTVLVNTDDLTIGSDGEHLVSNSQMSLGYRVFKAFIQ